MIEPGEIRNRLIDRLAAIFGKPKGADGLAIELAKSASANATVEALDALAEWIIATRKTKGFPPASELIAAVKTLAPTARTGGGSGAQDDGTIRFGGEAPVTWVPADDPRWGELVRLDLAAAKARAPGHQCHISPTSSKYAPGLGWYFPSAMVDALPLTVAERETLKATRDPQAIVERVAAGMTALGRRVRRFSEPIEATPAGPGDGRYAQALRDAVELPRNIAVGE